MPAEGNRVKRLGILLSGRGSNFAAIAEAIRTHKLLGAEIAVVLSNVADAPGLKIAAEMGLTAIAVPSAGRKRVEHDAEMIARLHQYKADLVCLAGYMRILTPEFVRAFSDRILNVHPSLLPAFPGLDAQGQALRFGAKVAGCTVHFVDEAVDHGAIILQRAVPVLDDDTAASEAWSKSASVGTEEPARERSVLQRMRRRAGMEEAGDIAHEPECIEQPDDDRNDDDDADDLLDGAIHRDQLDEIEQQTDDDQRNDDADES
jgi:phosphoribosylglycinamide formyltransferase-1